MNRGTDESFEIMALCVNYRKSRLSFTGVHSTLSCTAEHILYRSSATPPLSDGEPG